MDKNWQASWGVLMARVADNSKNCLTLRRSKWESGMNYKPWYG